MDQLAAATHTYQQALTAAHNARQHRDQIIRRLYNEGHGATQLARTAGLRRERIYQIIADTDDS